MSVHDEIQLQKLAAEAKARGRQPWEIEAERAVPTSLVRDLVSDAYKGISRSASMIPDRPQSENTPRGTGWQDAAPLKPPAGISYVDQLCSAQDRIDRAAALKVRIETALVEAHLEQARAPRIESEYNPIQKFDDEVPPAHREKP